jgi:hypothetical protein
MNEHTWEVGGHAYRVGLPVGLGVGSHAVIQRRSLLGGTWETVSEDAAIAGEILKLASEAGKSRKR